MEDSNVLDLDAARLLQKEAEEAKKKEEKDKKDAEEAERQRKIEEKMPIETFWTKELMRRGDYAIFQDQTGESILYTFCRKKRTWVASKENDIFADVTNYLVTHKYSKYGEANKVKCAKITESHIYTFGRKLKRTKEFIISTINHFLEVTPEGIQFHDKDEVDCKKFFCRVHVDVDLSKKIRLKDMKKFYICDTNEEIESRDTYFQKLITRGFKKVENRRAFQEFMGDTLNPVLRKAFPVLIGEPDGGKSQMIDMLLSLHAPFSTSIDLDRLDTFDTESLLGCSFVAVDEIGDTIKEKQIKQLVGGASFTIQRKKIKNLKIKPEAKLMGGANKPSTYREKTGALETRFYYIHVDKVKAEDRIAEISYFIDLHDKIDMLEWALNGAMAVIARGRILRHEEMPEDSIKMVGDMKKKSNPCIDFLQYGDAHFSSTKLTPKIQVYRAYKNYCEQYGRSISAKVSYEVFVRDYFSKAIGDICKDYDATLERRASVMLDGTKKRVECFPIYFRNDEMLDKTRVKDDEAIKTYHDPEAYAQDNLPAHILERVTREMEELNAQLNLSKKQKEVYIDNKMSALGYKKDASGGYSIGDNIQF